MGNGAGVDVDGMGVAAGGKGVWVALGTGVTVGTEVNVGLGAWAVALVGGGVGVFLRKTLHSPMPSHSRTARTREEMTSVRVSGPCRGREVWVIGLGGLLRARQSMKVRRLYYGLPGGKSLFSRSRLRER